MSTQIAAEFTEFTNPNLEVLYSAEEIRARVAGDPTALVGRMTAAFALGQIAGPVVSALLLYWPALAAQGLALALQAAAAALMLSALWLARRAFPTASRETRHA
jgi:hypothetical protein